MSRAVEGGLPLGTCPLGNRVPEEGSVEWNVSAVRPCRADTATQLRCARAVQTRPLSCGALVPCRHGRSAAVRTWASLKLSPGASR